MMNKKIKIGYLVPAVVALLSVLFILNPQGAARGAEFVSGEIRVALPSTTPPTPPPSSTPVFDFSLTNSGAISATQGSLVTNTINVVATAGIAQATGFAFSGLPTGASGTFSQNACFPTCSTTLTITTQSATPAGTYKVTITAFGGTQTKTSSFSLAVTQPLITIISPNGGETFQIDSLQSITWTTGQYGKKYTISIVDKDGSRRGGIATIAGIAGDKQSYSWNVGSVTITSGQSNKQDTLSPGDYKIFIANDTGDSDQSDAPFSVVPAPFFIGTLTQDLWRGSSGDQVILLQTIFSTIDPSYPENSITGYFGLATENAVKRFQEKYGIINPPSGYVGPKTRAKINELYGTLENPEFSVVAHPDNLPLIVLGQFTLSQKQRIQASIDKIYALVPDDYKKMSIQPIIVNTNTINGYWSNIMGLSKGEIEKNHKGRSFHSEDDTFINGDWIDFIVTHPEYSTNYFDETLVHENAHALAREKFSDVDGDSEWKALHKISVNENTGFALPTVLSDDETKPYAATTASEDLAMTVQAYIFTNGAYKTGDARSDKILAQKFSWLEQNGFIKRMGI